MFNFFYLTSIWQEENTTLSPSKALITIALCAVLPAGAAATNGTERGVAVPAMSLPATSLSIDELMDSILVIRGSLPARAVELALKAYEIYRTYRNGQAVEALQIEVQTVLELVHGLKDEVQVNRDLVMRTIEMQWRSLLTIKAVVFGLNRDFRQKMCKAGFVRRAGKCANVSDGPPRV